MMVAIAPNWSDVEGRITALGSAAEAVQGFVPLTLELTAAREVEGFISMVRQEDKGIEIRFPVESALNMKLAPGQRIAVRVRRGGPEKVFFIHREYLRLLEP